MDSPDIQAKYQKLASEYSKLRAQNQVLKKAVIEEQAKSLQSSDVLKEKDQSLRKSEQENESLTFRNQQLTKRLTLLQEDLDILQNKGKKSKSKQNSVSADGFMDGNNVFTEELQGKIHENARLHAQLADTEQMYSKQLADMEGKLDDVQKDLKKKQDSQQLTQIAASERVDQLEGELVVKELNQQSLLKEHSAAKEELARLQDLLQSATIKQKQAQEATSQNEVSETSLQDQNNTSDTSCLASEQLIQTQKSQPSQSSPAAGSNLRNRSTSDLHINCNQLSRDGRVSSKTLVQTFDSLIQEMCDSFTKFMQGFISRVKLHPSNSNIKQKLLEQLNSGVSVWNSLSASYHAVAVSATSETFVALETLSGLPSVSQNVTYCSASLRKLTPAMIHWSSEESGAADDDLSNRALNTWGSAFSRITATWGSLTPYVSTLATQNMPNSNLPPSAQGRVFTMLADRLHQLHSALKEASQVWMAKIEREHHDSKMSSELKVTSQQVADGLQALDSVVAKMSGVFREQVLTSWSRGGSTPSTPSSPYPPLPQSTSTTSLNQEVISSVVHSEAVLPSVETSESQAVLEKQLSLASSKLSQMEAEREHWRLEHQLLHCKHQKEEKRVRELEARLNRVNIKGSTDEGDGKGNLNNTNDVRDRTTSSTSQTSIVGEVSGSSLSASEEREKEIRNHFTNRCSHLYMQLTQTTGTASLYQNECESLMRRLVICEEKCVGAEQEVDNQRASVNQLKETLQITSRNYEEQISTMSEHLADLNEKIATQTDHIEQLKFEIKNRKAKK